MKNRQFYRRGPLHRQSDMSFVDIRRQFDFRSIELGKWVTNEEKHKAANLFHDALCDLMTILRAPESLISLRGTLALQYGKGGQRYVSAHYDPSTRSFALAKNAGPGSIAHEWFHAFDHYICSKLYDENEVSRHQFASSYWLEDGNYKAHPINHRLVQCFQTILLSEDGEEPSDVFKQSVRVDKKMNTQYFSQPEEICARAFEAFIQDQPIKNEFLVKGTKESDEAKLGLYPQGQHRVRINHTFKDYFQSLGQALYRESQR